MYYISCIESTQSLINLDLKQHALWRAEVSSLLQGYKFAFILHTVCRIAVVKGDTIVIMRTSARFATTKFGMVSIDSREKKTVIIKEAGWGFSLAMVLYV